MTLWSYWWRQVRSRIWFRAAAISLLAVVLALASAGLAPLVPYKLGLTIGSEAVDRILTILASSMLAVTTFSLTAMVAAFSGASSQVTPRATQLLIEDSTAQNALSTFLGGFLFAIVGIITLSTGFYGEQGRAILFLGMIGMIGWIVVTLLRWIHVLTRFGRVEDAIRRIELAGIAAIDSSPLPLLLAGPATVTAPAGAISVAARGSGYVRHVNLAALSEVAEDLGVRLTLAAPPGCRTGADRPLAFSDGPLDDRARARIRDAFAISRTRDFTNDPRYAMIVLAEIGSRALSHAVNDPGTAIAALDSAERLVAAAVCPRPPVTAPAGLVLTPWSVEEMVEDIAFPLMRDSAPLLEVGIRLQQWLGTVARLVPALRPRARTLADDAVARAEDSGMAAVDLARLRTAHDQLP